MTEDNRVDEGITAKQMLKRLKDKVSEYGGQAELSRHWGVTPQSISNALTCAKLPSPAILKLLKLSPVKEIRYRYKELR